VSVFRLPSGIVDLVIQLFQSSSMFFIAMLFLLSLVIQTLLCVMHVSKGKVISYLFPCLLM
jgi:hypothetical protein